MKIPRKYGISEQRMADPIRTVIKKKWFTAEKLDEIRKDEHQNENEILEQH